jgi:hypothetical protein
VNFERDPIAQSPISVVVPTHSGQDVRGFLETQTKHLKDLKREHEVLVLFDRDNPPATAVATLAQQNHHVQVLRSETAEGSGEMLRRGLTAARHPLIFVVPADAEYAGVRIEPFLAAIDQVDVVCGVRSGRGGWAPLRRPWSAWWIFGSRVADPTCPVRLYRRAFLQRMPLQSRGNFIHLEMLAKANFLEGLLAEVPLGVAGPADRTDAFGRADLFTVWFRPRFRMPEPTPAAG